MHNRCHWFQVQSNIREWNAHQCCTMLKMNTRATHQRFLFGKLQIFLSASGVHFSCLLLSTVKQQFEEHRVWLGRWKKGTFYSYSFTILWGFPLRNTCIQWPLIPSQGVTGVGHREVIYQSGRYSDFQKNMSTCMGPVKHYLREYHFISRRRVVSALALQTYSRKMFGTQ